MKHLMRQCETAWKQEVFGAEQDIPSPVMEIPSVVKAGDSKEVEFRYVMVSA